MISLTKRQKLILEYLEKKNDFVTIATISDYLGVSPRTIRNDLDAIEAGIKDDNITLDRKPRSGIKLIIKDQGSLEGLLEKNIQILSSEDRVNIIILCILLREKSTIEDLAESIQVSKNTVVQDLNQVESILKTYEIKLKKKAYYGIFTEGSEEKHRMAFSNIFTKLDDKLKAKIYASFEIQKRLSDEEIEKKLQCLENTLEVLFSEEAIEELTINYLLSKRRSDLGFSIVYSIEELDCYRKRKEFLLIKELMDIKESEACYLVKLFDGGRRANGSEDLELAEHLINDFCERLSLKCKVDEKFINQINMHLKIAMSRIKNKMLIENPILEDVKLKMGFIYKLTEQILFQNRNLTGLEFPESEIAYMAMYFDAIFELNIKDNINSKILLVCNGGMATSSLLKTRIAMMIPQAEITSICRLSEVEKVLETKKIDFIVTTIPLNVQNMKVLKVDALLNPGDIDKIKNEIFEIRNEKKTKLISKALYTEEKTSLSMMFSPEVTQIGLEVKDWKDAIKIATEPLIKVKAVDKEYPREIIKVIENLGNYMVFIPKIAFVHATPEYVNKNSMSVLIMKEEISFGSGTQVPVKVIIVLANKTENMHLVNLVNILTKGDNIDKFLNVAEYSHIDLIN